MGKGVVMRMNAVFPFIQTSQSCPPISVSYVTVQLHPALDVVPITFSTNRFVHI
jgi:hypothetical protein